MSKWDKLIARICALSKDMRFDELRKVLESYGYVMYAPRSGSSHYTFRKAGCQPITIPKHEPSCLASLTKLDRSATKLAISRHASHYQPCHFLQCRTQPHQPNLSISSLSAAKHTPTA